MATKISIEQWEQLFCHYDKDKSGTLDIMELKNLLQSNNSNVSDSQIADMFVFMAGPGVNKNSKITKDEFIKGIQNIFAFVDQVTALFKRFDSDNNGHLNPTELRKLLLECDSSLSDETIDCILKAADTNRDGQVSLEEFLKALS